jgi:hypothetical protein
MNVKNLTLIIACLLLVFSCEKETDKSPGCSVGGLWIGTWTAADTVGGTFFAPVDQDENDVSGEVLIRFAKPNNDSYSTEFFGNVINKKFKSFFDISYVDIKVTGLVENDNAVEGNYETTIGINGTFSGKKLSVTEPGMTEIHSSQTGIAGIICVGEKLWAFTRESFYGDGDNVKLIVNLLDFNGNYLDTLHFPYFEGIYAFGNVISYENGKIRVLDNGYFDIYTYDTLGNLLNTITSPIYYPDAIACINNNIYISDSYNRITHVLNPDGTENSTFPNDYVSISAICEYKGNLLMAALSYDFLIKTDMEGMLLEAYKLPGNCRSICTDGNWIWCLIEEYVSVGETDPGYSVYKIYKFQIN